MCSPCSQRSAPARERLWLLALPRPDAVAQRREAVAPRRAGHVRRVRRWRAGRRSTRARWLTFANDERCRARDASGGQRGCARDRVKTAVLSARRFASAAADARRSIPGGRRAPRRGGRHPRADELARRSGGARALHAGATPLCDGHRVVEGNGGASPVWEITAAVETLSRTWRRAAPGIPDRGGKMKKLVDQIRWPVLAALVTAVTALMVVAGSAGAASTGATAAQNLGQASSVVGGLSGSVGK